MIYKLRRRFIAVSAISVGVVFSVIFTVICVINIFQLNKTTDFLTGAISLNKGVFPNYNDLSTLPSFEDFYASDAFTPETPYSTRFFTVEINKHGEIISENTNNIYSVSPEQSRMFAQEVLKSGSSKGWISEYRYQVTETDYGKSVVFVNASVSKSTAEQLLLSVFSVMAGSYFVILFLIILLSKKAVKPTAEAFEKQKQFITDANHELKTPLTLIMSNLDIVESETGENEWLDDMRNAGQQMGKLINHLVTLSRMDEEKTNIEKEKFDLSNTVSDVASEFEALAYEKSKNIITEIEPFIEYEGDEALIRRLLAILLDNAVTYCDENGMIVLTVSLKGYNPVITIENSYADVGKIEIEKLFDRFYRADKARTCSGNFGIGLSIAKSIVQNHNGKITSYKKDETHIGFKIILK